MKKIINSISLVTLFLLLSGCNLKVYIDGEGTVTSLNTDFECLENSCSAFNGGEPKRFELQANPAPGYTSLGILSTNGLFKATDDFYYHTRIGFQMVAYYPVNPDNGQGKLTTSPATTEQEDTATGQISIPTPTYFVTYSDTITAIFLPTDDIQTIYEGYRSSCVHFTDGGFRCWGGPFDRAPSNFSNIYLVRNTDNTMCVADDNGLRCWGTGYYDQSKVPADLGNVTDFSVSAYHTCAIANGNIFTPRRNTAK